MAEPEFSKYVFVCENRREDGRTSCGAAGERLTQILREVVRSERLPVGVRVCRSGCLDACEKGPNVLIEPDHILFQRVEDSDIPKVLEVLRARKVPA